MTAGRMFSLHSCLLLSPYLKAALGHDGIVRVQLNPHPITPVHFSCYGDRAATYEGIKHDAGSGDSSTGTARA